MQLNFTFSVLYRLVSLLSCRCGYWISAWMNFRLSHGFFNFSHRSNLAYYALQLMDLSKFKNSFTRIYFGGKIYVTFRFPKLS